MWLNDMNTTESNMDLFDQLFWSALIQNEINSERDDIFDLSLVK